MYVGGGWRSENVAGERGRRPMMRCVRPMMRCVRPMMRGVCDKRCAVCATNDAVCAVCAAETKRRKLRVSHVHHARRSATLQRSRLGIAAPGRGVNSGTVRDASSPCLTLTLSLPRGPTRIIACTPIRSHIITAGMRLEHPQGRSKCCLAIWCSWGLIK